MTEPIESHQQASEAHSHAAALVRQQQVERSVLQATEALLADRTFDGITIEDILIESGLSLAEFDSAFCDLMSVFVRLIGDVLVQANRGSDWLAADLDADYPALFLHLGTNAARLYVEHRPLMLALNDAPITVAELKVFWDATMGGIADRISKRINFLNEKGVTHVHHPEEMAWAVLLMATSYLCDRFREGVPELLEVVAETVGDVMYRAIFFND